MMALREVVWVVSAGRGAFRRILAAV